MSYPNTMNNIRQVAYQLYKFDWKISHNITTEREIKAIKEYLSEYPKECFTHAFPPNITFDEFMIERGYDGEYFVCFEEFVDCEYQDAEYIESLFEGMDPGYLDEYYKDDIIEAERE